ncbi:divergent PAP2 family protein [Paenibacillus xerothermodurans]|uniref:Divergent PAP2 family protein n=1 Tax=Paenibacillus xerothermodurans TaxID=1977292 RepID=A0A2W1N4B8_PAEXE|nr:divergent PAP2 family protein [Paenibacillus xerothermodurans]PZE19599.1 divergent PAP2 family protein [Paenibacillus xerothermodurans]
MNATINLLYPALPFIAWVCSGALKYLINRLRFGDQAREHIGNGGFPSTHTSVISSITMLIGFEHGFGTPLFGLAVAITYVVMIDAVGLRRAVGESAKWVNRLAQESTAVAEQVKLREKQGHTRPEVLGGLALGTLLAWGASAVL